MKKSIVALTLALALSLSIAGCSSNERPEESSKPVVNNSAQIEQEPTLDYPKGPITCLVGYSAGGGSDMAVRTFGEYFAPKVGEAFTISNVTGGSGTVAVSQLKHSDPDGYTMGLTTLNTQSISPFSLDVDYTNEDFDYLGALGKFTYAILVSAESPYQTFDDILADAKQGTIQCSGTATLHELLGMKVSAATGGDFEVVYYPSTADAITDLLGGFIPAAVGDIASYSSYVEAGQMRVLAYAAEDAWPVAPAAPTLKSLGYEDTVLESLLGLALPKGTDPEVLSFLREKFDETVNEKEFQDKLYETTKLIPVQYNAQEYYDVLVNTYAENEVILADLNK